MYFICVSILLYFIPLILTVSSLFANTVLFNGQSFLLSTKCFYLLSAHPLFLLLSLSFMCECVVILGQHLRSCRSFSLSFLSLIVGVTWTPPPPLPPLVLPRQLICLLLLVNGCSLFLCRSLSSQSEMSSGKADRVDRTNDNDPVTLPRSLCLLWSLSFLLSYFIG